MDSPFRAWRAHPRRFADPGETLLASPSCSSFPTSAPSSSVSCTFLALPSPVFLESPAQGPLFLEFPKPGPCRRENHHPWRSRPAQQQMQAPPALFPAWRRAAAALIATSRGSRPSSHPSCRSGGGPGGSFQEPSELSQL